MGSGAWSTHVYADTTAATKAAGRTPFHYSDSGATRVHDRLNPVNVTREARDSDEHPESLPICVKFDVTGSMLTVPRTMQLKLPGLWALLRDKGYVAHPQIMFGAIGDAFSDRAPLQVGQFESDNRSDEDLAAIYLEGNGGGQMSESYELAMYFVAKHTATDSWEKRGRRGYFFIIGDEMPYNQVTPAHVQRWTGDVISEAITTEALVAQLKEKWDVYFILPGQASHTGNPQVLAAWRKLLGQNVIELDDPEAVCETIALTVGLGEGRIDLATGLGHLADVGSKAGDVVGSALATVAKSAVVASGPALAPAVVGEETVERL